MSTPISAMMTSATLVKMPGIVTIRSRAARKNSITTSMRSVISSMAASVLVDQCEVEPHQEGVLVIETSR